MNKIESGRLVVETIRDTLAGVLEIEKLEVEIKGEAICTLDKILSGWTDAVDKLSDEIKCLMVESNKQGIDDYGTVVTAWRMEKIRDGAKFLELFGINNGVDLCDCDDWVDIDEKIYSKLLDDAICSVGEK